MVEEIREHPLIKGKNTALSHRAATICFYTQGFCNWAQARLEDQSGEVPAVKEILDRQPASSSRSLRKRYVRTLHYIINAQIELGDFKEARENIKALRALQG